MRACNHRYVIGTNDIDGDQVRRAVKAADRDVLGQHAALRQGLDIRALVVERKLPGPVRCQGKMPVRGIAIDRGEFRFTGIRIGNRHLARCRADHVFLDHAGADATEGRWRIVPLNLDMDIMPGAIGRGNREGLG